MRSTPPLGWSNIIVPGMETLNSGNSVFLYRRMLTYFTSTDKETLVFDAGKLFVLDGLLERLKSEGHRVLIYSQMTKMIDLLEEYMTHRKHTFIR
jgi:DNA helicase INO80